MLPLLTPRNDIDKFDLAQPTFLSAISGDQTHAVQLRDARKMFAESAALNGCTIAIRRWKARSYSDVFALEVNQI
jgi:hypothetical protein